MIRVGQIRTSSEMAGILADFNPGDGPFVILPNWHCRAKGYGTDARTLDCLLSALPGRKTVIEAYDAARTEDGKRFHGLDLEGARQHLDYLREQDKLFLAETGIGDVLAKHEAEYLNVTEEVWAGRVAHADDVAGLVEERTGGPVVHREFYSAFPQRLWDMKETATLVNFGKLKVGILEGRLFFSLAMKNLFGLIPVPDRTAYHGSGDEGLSRSIVDMNQIYCSAFRTISTVEAIYNAQASTTLAIADLAAVVEDLGFMVVSDSSVEADAFVVKQFGERPENRYFLRMGREMLGGWDEGEFPPLPAELAERLRKIVKN